MSKRNQLLAGLVLLLAVVATYSNHFQNSFHFDDWHAVTQNPAIRSLKNFPRFFSDARTISTLPSNQMYRPLLTASLALDYWAAGGLEPLYFHLSTFLWFLLLLGMLWALFERLTERLWVSWVAVTWYALHPACAETVNYIVQRADLLATVGVVGALLLWIRHPASRRYGIYLLPMILGALAKPTALMFAPILAVYLWLFEGGARRITAAFPAFATAAAVYLFQSAMLPRTLVLGGDPYRYIITQPWVTLLYLRSLFLPLWLSADTDRQALATLWSMEGLSGVGFVLLLAGGAWLCSRRRQTRPIAFGLLWFLLGLAPTALVPLAEVENDHRMFLPFVGLVLAVCQGVALLWDRVPRRRVVQLAGMVFVVCVLATYAVGTYQRNRVWRTEESLWEDVTRKSPRNGRGLMNYGITQMQKGDARRALSFFERADVFTPNYAFLEINLGIATGLLQRDREAEAHFLRAISLAPNEAITYFYYAQWLRARGRTEECIDRLRRGLARNARDPESRYLLMQVLTEQQRWPEVKQAALETLRLFPEDAKSLHYLTVETAFEKQVADTAALAKRIGSPEAYSRLALLYFRAGRYEESAAAAEEALRLRPSYAEALESLAKAHSAAERSAPETR